MTQPYTLLQFMADHPIFTVIVLLILGEMVADVARAFGRKQ